MSKGYKTLAYKPDGSLFVLVGANKMEGGLTNVLYCSTSNNNVDTKSRLYGSLLLLFETPMCNRDVNTFLVRF